jgi:acetyl-CoA carboxylase carboxyl transferase subunit beta
MSILTWIEEKKRLKLLNAPKYVNPASDQPDLLSDGAPRSGRSSQGLWTRCDKCGVILYIKHLKENQRVCFGCTYHLQMSSQERIENLLDKESWRPFDETVSPCDPLEFHDQRNYTDRLRDAQDKTGLQDAIQTGTGLVDGIPVALGIMDFDFMGGSMGSVVGEKITRLIEYATQEGLTLLLVCASGGARMQEGVFSLMQMAKISSALQIYQSCANLLYISILTSPTTGGVTASFAMLGDIIFAEPKALIAFAGRRVIEQTLCEDLPEDFQTSEYMLHHGLVDLIVPRRFLRQALSESIRLYKNAPFKKPGRIPFGVQNPISFLTEEKLRRQCRTELDLGLTRSRRLTKNSSRASLLLSPEGAQHGPEGQNFVQAAPVPGVIESRLGNPSNALTDQRRAINQPSVGSGRSVRQGDILLAPEGGNRSVVPARQSVEYREILTSFQMMYQLFSKAQRAQVGASLWPLRGKLSSIESQTKQTSNGVLGLPKATYPALELPKDVAKRGAIAKHLDFARSAKQSVVPPEHLDFARSAKQIGFATQNFGLRSNRLPYYVGQDSSLLQKFRELAEGVTHLVFQTYPVGKPEAVLSSREAERGSEETSRERSSDLGPPGLGNSETFTPAITKAKVEEGSSNHTVPSLLSKALRPQIGTTFRLAIKPEGANRLPSATKETADGASPPRLVRSISRNNRDFLNQALELAATESVEWRAFYVHQTISKTTGFLEDFLSSGQYTELRGSTDKVSTVPAQLQNTLFYKSICRTTIG